MKFFSGRKIKAFLCVLIAAVFMFTATACEGLTESDINSILDLIGQLINSAEINETEITEAPSFTEENPPTDFRIDENGTYDSKDEVALYIHTYGFLPKNYVTKEFAESKGWKGGSVEKSCPGCCIGGDYYGNFGNNGTQKLPTKKDRTYHECDIDTLGKKSRGEKRLVYSNDGLIFYTDDHYKTFVQLY